MAFQPFNWTCPSCSRPQVVTEPNIHTTLEHVSINESNIGSVSFHVQFITCCNVECKSPQVSLSIYNDYRDSNWNYHIYQNKRIYNRKLLPDGNYNPYPDYIPIAIKEDYQEACLIRDLSPKASATLARRCLQGMIRDFCQISKKTLDQEIRALKELVDQDDAPKGVSHESIDAIDHVRTVGNIGAHMEKDVDHIVPVEPQEAQMLIDLIESLFDEWYIERHKRQARFGGLKALADEKKALREAGKKPDSPLETEVPSE